MLFNSYAFLFGFLPLALIGYQIAGHFHRRAVVVWLGFMSLVFYAYWRPAIVFLLLVSIAINYLAAELISRHIPNTVSVRVWLWIAICADLGLLGFFKYLFPFLNFASQVTGSSYHWSNVILPLGISFFTFTQIAYLVDLSQGDATRQDLSSYVLFVTFFPHLIAGPILHHKEMMPQFQQDRSYRLRSEDVIVGLSWFIMGLGKKVLLADNFARTAGLVYDAPGSAGLLLAWRGVLTYALQLYFDFSGYSDMALGLARMFSIDFPLNFSSPYKATNIIDFWQRWHITLTQYITSYLYSPLQFWIIARRQEQGKKVSRKAQATLEGFASMIAFPMIFTMFIAGVWHGAGLQFLIFGVLHGIYLTVNHAWRLFRTKAPAHDAQTEPSPVIRAVSHASSVALTFLCVLVAQVFFRALSSRGAFSLLAGMVGTHGLGKISFAGETHFFAAVQLFILLAGFLIVWGMPNTQQILRDYHPSLRVTPWDQTVSFPRVRWNETVAWSLLLGSVMFMALVGLQDPSTFLYFQF